MAEYVLENSYLRVSINREKGWFNILEKTTNTLWSHDPWKDAAGEFILEDRLTGVESSCNLSKATHIYVKRLANSVSPGVEIEFEDLVTERGERLCDLSVTTDVLLDKDKPEVVIKVLKIKEGYQNLRLKSLQYPARHFFLRTHVDQGYAVLPLVEGIMIPSSKTKTPPGEFMEREDVMMSPAGEGNISCFGIQGLSMPWFGSVKERSSFIGIIETPNDAGVTYVANYDLQHVFNRVGEASSYARIVSVSPNWRMSHGHLGYERVVRYHFAPEGGYVTMAKFYRKYVKETGLFKSMKEKIQENPEVEKLLGAPWIGIHGGYPQYVDYDPLRFDFEDLKRIIVDLHDSVGIENAFIAAWGIYSQVPPDCFPIDESKGGASKLAEVTQIAKEQNYVFSGYNTYSATLPNTPNWCPDKLRKDANGRIGFRWGNVCSSFLLDFAKMYTPRVMELIGQRGDHTDITLAGTFSECYDPKHPLTRSDDKYNKMQLLKYLKSLGQVVGSETGADWAIPYCDYFAGMSRFNIMMPLLGKVGFPVPMFSLVYHDAVVVYNHEVNDWLHNLRVGQGDYIEKCLWNLLVGNPPLYIFAAYEYKEGLKSRIKESYNLIGNLPKDLGLDEMVDHRFLSDDFTVQKSVFSSGVEVTVNFGLNRSISSGVPIPPMGFWIKDRKGKMIKGQLSTQCRIE